MNKLYKFTSSQIRYIICMYRLSQGGYGVKNIEIANALGISKPSVHNMLKILSEMGIVRQKYFGVAHLTDEGMVLARNYSFCFSLLEEKLLQIIGIGIVSEKSVCAVLADIPYRKIVELNCNEE